MDHASWLPTLQQAHGIADASRYATKGTIGLAASGEGFTVISIYIGNLPYDTTEDQVVELFKPFGEVNRAALVTDRETHRPRGFGFVEMPNNNEAQKAIEELSGKDFKGRPLTVNEARNRSAQRNAANLSRSAHKDDDTPEDGDDTGNDDSSRGYSNPMRDS